MLPFTYAVRNLFRSKSRLLQTIGGSATVVLLVMTSVAINNGMERVLSASGSERNVTLIGAGSEESIERCEIHYMNYLTLPDGRRSQAMLRGVTLQALRVHPAVRLTGGNFPGAGELMVGRLAWRKLGLAESDLKPGGILTLENQPMKTKTTCLALATAALLASCGKKESTAATPAAPPVSSALSAVLAAAPTGEPKPIHLIRATAKPGDGITVSGKIMGNEKPFVDGRAAFILGDPEVLTACNEDSADKCTTPWDNCCDSPEDKKRGIATIQIVGADGRVLKESVEGVGGLANLAAVTVTGKVAEGSSADLLIINAQAIRPGK